jgi:cytidylate kinase
LPRECGLAVRIIAPLERRIERVMTRDGLDRMAAADHVRQTDLGRRDFARQHFRRDVADPQLYDLVINTAHLSPDAAAALIVEGFRQRFASATSPATSPTPALVGNRHTPRP